MPPGYNLAIASSIGMIAAMDVPFPVELTALAMVGLVLRWALIRQNRSHDEHDARISRIEEDLEVERLARLEEKHLKHAWRNEVTSLRATIAMVLPTAQRCSCGTMEPLLPVLQRLATDTREPS